MSEHGCHACVPSRRVFSQRGLTLDYVHSDRAVARLEVREVVEGRGGGWHVARRGLDVLRAGGRLMDVHEHDLGACGDDVLGATDGHDLLIRVHARASNVLQAQQAPEVAYG